MAAVFFPFDPKTFQIDFEGAKRIGSNFSLSSSLRSEEREESEEDGEVGGEDVDAREREREGRDFVFFGVV